MLLSTDGLRDPVMMNRLGKPWLCAEIGLGASAQFPIERLSVPAADIDLGD